ncbi:MAG: hypothetical protein M3P11_13620 [Actinomycetota bacterium]|nr:hypothetical protein [Actinomycetota bacterium]
MMMRAKSSSVVLALILLVSAACTSNEDPPAETTSVSPPPEAHVLAESDCPHYDCQGALEPGLYRATYFDPEMAFEITTPGWTWSYTGNLQMFAIDEAAEGHDADVINFFLDPVIAAQDCKDGPEPGVERSVDDLVAWLQAAPGLTTSDGTPVTVGGLDGVRLDLQVAPEWKKDCFYSDGKPVVPLIYSSAFPGGYNWAISPPTSMRWYVLDTGIRVLIVDIEDNPKGLSRDALFESGTEIVETFAFSSSS